MVIGITDISRLEGIIKIWVDKCEQAEIKTELEMHERFISFQIIFYRDWLDNMKLRETANIKRYRCIVSKLMLESEQVHKVDDDSERVKFKYNSLTKTKENVS